MELSDIDWRVQFNPPALGSYWRMGQQIGVVTRILDRDVELRILDLFWPECGWKVIIVDIGYLYRYYDKTCPLPWRKT